jgi:hypothetical protein
VFLRLVAGCSMCCSQLESGVGVIGGGVSGFMSGQVASDCDRTHMYDSDVGLPPQNNLSEIYVSSDRCLERWQT